MSDPRKRTGEDEDFDVILLLAVEPQCVRSTKVKTGNISSEFASGRLSPPFLGGYLITKHTLLKTYALFRLDL